VVLYKRVLEVYDHRSSLSSRRSRYRATPRYVCEIGWLVSHVWRTCRGIFPIILRWSSLVAHMLRGIATERWTSILC